MCVVLSLIHIYIPASSVDGDYIDCLSEVDYATAVTEDYGFVTAVTGLNFRTEPTLDGDIISVLPYMTKAEIIDSDDEWVHICLLYTSSVVLTANTCY